MLVLSRKEEQQIVVDQRIKITVLQIQGNRVRIGIEAPQDVSIRRSELQPHAPPLPAIQEQEVTLPFTLT